MLQRIAVVCATGLAMCFGTANMVQAGPIHDVKGGYCVEYHLDCWHSLCAPCYETARHAQCVFRDLGCDSYVKCICGEYKVFYYLPHCETESFACEEDACLFETKLMKLGFHTLLKKPVVSVHADVLDLPVLGGPHDVEPVSFEHGPKGDMIGGGPAIDGPILGGPKVIDHAPVIVKPIVRKSIIVRDNFYRPRCGYGRHW